MKNKAITIIAFLLIIGAIALVKLGKPHSPQRGGDIGVVIGKTAQDFKYLRLVECPINHRGAEMAAVCPMQDCKSKEGMCMHDWLMAGMVVIIAAFVIAKLANVF